MWLVGHARYRWLVPRPSPPALSLLPCLHFQNGLRTPLRHRIFFPPQLPDAKNLLCQRRQRRRHLANPCAPSSSPSLAISQPPRRPTLLPLTNSPQFFTPFQTCLLRNLLGWKSTDCLSPTQLIAIPCAPLQQPPFARFPYFRGCPSQLRRWHHRHVTIPCALNRSMPTMPPPIYLPTSIRPIRLLTPSQAKSKSTVTS